VRDEVYEGLDCFVVEQYPIDKTSGYTRQVVWLDKAEYRLWKVEYYDRKSALLKTLTMSQYEQYFDRYWRHGAMRMQNHQSGKSTLLTLTNYRLRTGMRASDFHPSVLEQAH
jgi:Outer membrane lipoprotein-sorting protein